MSLQCDNLSGELQDQWSSSTKFGNSVLQLNASDDRGIGVVREKVLSFASTRTIFKLVQGPWPNIII